MRHLIPLLAAGLTTLAAAAEPPRHALEVQASVVAVSPETRRLIVDNVLGPSLGTSVGIAYRGLLPSAGLEHRLHLDLLGLKAQESTGMEGANPKHLSFGWDVIFRRGGFNIYSGFLGQRWKQSLDDQTSNDFRDYSLTGARLMNSPRGTKLGGRIGAEFALRPRVAAFVSYTQTELNKKHNPGWFSFGVVYRVLQR